jgi:hypothetical protein
MIKSPTKDEPSKKKEEDKRMEDDSTKASKPNTAVKGHPLFDGD